MKNGVYITLVLAALSFAHPGMASGAPDVPYRPGCNMNASPPIANDADDDDVTFGASPPLPHERPDWLPADCPDF